MSVFLLACVAEEQTGAQNSEGEATPEASQFTPSPLRNRIVIRLDASPNEVWALVGVHERMPEYSSGLESVRVERREGHEVRVCQFRAMDGQPEGLRFSERIVWSDGPRGYAALGESPNPFGLSGDLTRVTLRPDGGSTVVTWEQYYDAADLPGMRQEFSNALSNIADNLVRQFGGRVEERFVDG